MREDLLKIVMRCDVRVKSCAQNCNYLAIANSLTENFHLFFSHLILEHFLHDDDDDEVERTLLFFFYFPSSLLFRSENKSVEFRAKCC